MAGAFTHLAIMDEAAVPFPATEKIGKILRFQRKFVAMGCVSPDIPYLAVLDKDASIWANIFHYEKTNGIVHNGLHSLAAVKDQNESWQCQLAWLAGYVCHLVTDATIHPVVEAIVGPYSDSETHSRHGICEMIQDVFIFKEVKNLEISTSEFSTLLRECRDHPCFPKVIDFWNQHAKTNIPSASGMSGETFLKAFIDLLDLGEGGSAIAGLFRRLGVKYFYRTVDDLNANSPELVKDYYQNIRLPNGLKGSFREDAFNYAVKNTIDAWSQIKRALFTTDNVLSIVPNWNLDTGIEHETGIRTYWR
jgi:hypothetical protein